jgi:hypothetical protein
MMNPLAAAGAWEAAMQWKEHNERAAAYALARARADANRKPLLNVGCPAIRPLQRHPCGDVCLDLDPRILERCQASRPVVGDVRQIPFPNRYFGAALVCHVLEHLPTAEDASTAIQELHRVADAVYICSPSRASIAAWLHPGHRLWVDQHAGTITISQREA